MNDDMKSQMHQEAQQQQSMIQIRIDPSEELNDIRTYLANMQPVVRRDENGAYIDYVPSGKPRMNLQGINEYMSALKMIINKMNVQGNFKEDRLNAYLAEQIENLTTLVELKTYDWELSKIHYDHGMVVVDDTNMRSVIDFTMAFVEPFMSRTLFNEERKSLIPQFRSEERTVVNTQDTRAE